MFLLQFLRRIPLMAHFNQFVWLELDNLSKFTDRPDHLITHTAIFLTYVTTFY